MIIDFIYIQQPGIPSLKPYKTTKSMPSTATWRDLREETGPFFGRAIRREWPGFAWPGGYPLYYLTADNGILCPACANRNLRLTLGDDPQWRIVAQDVNWEDDGMTCDNCQTVIHSAYGPDTADTAADTTEEN